MRNNYGVCEECGTPLEAEWFIEKEYEIIYGCEYPTGRTRRAVSCLCCPHCLRQYVVDDSFDGPWR